MNTQDTAEPAEPVPSEQTAQAETTPAQTAQAETTQAEISQAQTAQAATTQQDAATEPVGGDAAPTPSDSSSGTTGREGGLVTPPPVATREPTGDVVVDAVLEEFDRVTGEPLDAHVEVGEKVHRTLQARLADLGDE